MSDAKYIFILGTGRTGTVFLKDFFNSHLDGCIAVQEPEHITKLMSNLYLSGKTRRNTMVLWLKHLKDGIDKNLHKSGYSIYIQSDAWLIGFAEVLSDVFPDAYVVHSVRHPMTYIPSFLNRYYRGAVEGFVRDMIPYWKLRGNKTGDYSQKDWKSLSLEEQMAWHWVKHNRVIEENKKFFNRYKLLRYEDMHDKNNTGLKDLVEFCDISLEFTDDVIQTAGQKKNAMKKKFCSAGEWSEQTMESVKSICSDLMNLYGYS